MCLLRSQAWNQKRIKPHVVKDKPAPHCLEAGSISSAFKPVPASFTNSTIVSLLSHPCPRRVGQVYENMSHAIFNLHFTVICMMLMLCLCCRSTRSASRLTCPTGSKCTTTKVPRFVNTVVLCCGVSPGRGSNVRVRGFNDFTALLTCSSLCWSFTFGRKTTTFTPKWWVWFHLTHTDLL